MKVDYLPPEEIAATVNALLLLDGISHSGEDVDVIEICRKHFGLGIHFADLKSSYGEETIGLVIAEHKLILCDSSIEPCGKEKEKKEKIMRFTVAHELGHYLFHQRYMTEESGPVFYQHLDKKERDRLEIQANVFAAMLLMPEKLFVKAYASLKSQFLKKQDITEMLAERFNVSKESVGYRIEALK